MMQSCWNTFRTWEIRTVRVIPGAGSTLLRYMCQWRTAPWPEPGQTCIQTCSACSLYVIMGVFILLFCDGVFPSHKMRINYIFANVQHKEHAAFLVLYCTWLTHTLTPALTFQCFTPTIQYHHGPFSRDNIYQNHHSKRKLSTLGEVQTGLHVAAVTPVPVSLWWQLVRIERYQLSAFLQNAALTTRAIYQAYKIQNCKTLNFIVICSVRSC